MREREIKLKVIENADKIAEILANKKDCEIRTSPNGIAIAEISKKIVAKS